MEVARLAPALWRDASPNGRVEPASRAALRQPGERADRQRRAEDLQVVPIDLVLEARLADLIQALETVEADACVRPASRADES